jgi:hypothetical protein
MDQSVKYQKMMQDPEEPIPISGPKEVPQQRKVLWKNVCQIGVERRECIVEMSRTKTKFFIVALDLEICKYHVIELFRNQANKILKACENSLLKLMKFLEFRFGTMCIKDLELLLNYQLYMSPEMIKERS